MSIRSDLAADRDRCCYCGRRFTGSVRYQRRRVVLPDHHPDAPGEPATVLDVSCRRCGISTLILWEAA